MDRTVDEKAERKVTRKVYRKVGSIRVKLDSNVDRKET